LHRAEWRRKGKGSISTQRRTVPADLKAGAFKGMQNQKSGFGMSLKESYRRATTTTTTTTTATTNRLPLEGFSCNLAFEGFSKICQGKFIFH